MLQCWYFYFSVYDDGDDDDDNDDDGGGDDDDGNIFPTRYLFSLQIKRDLASGQLQVKKKPNDLEKHDEHFHFHPIGLFK